MYSEITKSQLEEREETILADIARQYKSYRSEEKGLIMWLKPGVDRRIKPELIHLKEVVGFNFSERFVIVLISILCFNSNDAMV